MSKGCKGASRSLNDDLAGHLGVYRAKIRVSPCFTEGEGKLLVGVEHFRFEDTIRAHHGGGNVIAVSPRHRGPHRHGQRRRPAAAVIDVYLPAFWFLLGVSCKIILPRAERSDSE